MDDRYLTLPAPINPFAWKGYSGARGTTSITLYTCGPCDAVFFFLLVH